MPVAFMDEEDEDSDEEEENDFGDTAYHRSS